MLNLFGNVPRTDPAVLDRIKGWTREAFALGDEVVVMVTELRCNEPDCPDVETVIGVMPGPGDTRRHKLFKPAADVTRDDVFSLATH